MNRDFECERACCQESFRDSVIDHNSNIQKAYREYKVKVEYILLIEIKSIEYVITQKEIFKSSYKLK